ncbi:molecular chaperone [Solibacillus sp. MA9]|uniref:Molecular chaperone n=1 Tax=Solibacillus palustris TaxID=2908203 RepID=A0ABS9UAC7_9BACL|nr:molecular chaperone [Solibacillus sp. MA9]MCH7321286.1 molecular chaperone [Solibacillus sp. MA9]
MSKIASIIRQIDLAQNLLTLQFEQQRLHLSQHYLLRTLAVYQKVSLAENREQVKNTRSYMSSTND